MRARGICVLVWLAACGGGGGGDDGGVVDGPPAVCNGIDCSGHGTCVEVLGAATCQCDGGYVRDTATTCVAAVGPSLGGCPLLPVDHVFNTPIDGLPVHPMSDAFIATIGGTRKLHLDLGQTVDPQSAEYYGIPYNVVNGAGFNWPTVAYTSPDPDLGWNPRPEADCAVGAAHTLTSPCTPQAAPTPLLPIPPTPLVEGGISTASNHQPYGDHHILIVDAAECRLWETYHSYDVGGAWQIFGSAEFDLRSNALRPADWTSADAAGFPMLPLLLRADEASTGQILHALRFTIDTNKIRTSYTWPARHTSDNGTASTSLPQMGQLFRLKASYAIPGNANTQTRAILTAMKTYGIYLADGGSDMYITGDPSAAWDDATFTQVQAVPASAFEAVDLTPIMQRAGFDPDSAKVP